MEGAYRHFTLEERRTLFRLVNAKLPIKEIASHIMALFSGRSLASRVSLIS
jgi:hypothetical protein